MSRDAWLRAFEDAFVDAAIRQGWEEGRARLRAMDRSLDAYLLHGDRDAARVGRADFAEARHDD